jgi:hypothetical protein
MESTDRQPRVRRAYGLASTRCILLPGTPVRARLICRQFQLVAVRCSLLCRTRGPRFESGRPDWKARKYGAFSVLSGVRAGRFVPNRCPNDWVCHSNRAFHVALGDDGVAPTARGRRRRGAGARRSGRKHLRRRAHEPGELKERHARADRERCERVPHRVDHAALDAGCVDGRVPLSPPASRTARSRAACSRRLPRRRPLRRLCQHVRLNPRSNGATRAGGAKYPDNKLVTRV